MARLLYRLGWQVAAHPVLVLAIWVVAAVGVTVLVKTVGADTDNNLSLPGTGSQQATDLLEREFPPQQNGSNPIIFHRSGGNVTSAADKQAIKQSYDAIKQIPFVHSAVSPFSQEGAGQISKNKATAFISVLLSVGSNELTTEQAQRVLDAAEPGKKAGMEVVGGGSIGSTLSPNDTSSSDLIGILAAMVILTFTFGTVVAMGMPIGTAVLGLTTALGAIALLGHLTSVPDIASTVATMIGLAVGIDYALFLVTRHLTQLREGMEMHESIARAVGTAGTAVVFAGCTVVVALVSLVVAGIPLVSSLGYTAAVAVATAVLGAVTLLPALMALAGRYINSIALPAWLHPSAKPGKKGIWGTWAGLVVRRPYVPILLAALILVPLIIPVSDLRLGQEDIGQTPKSTMERQAYDLMSAGFGPGYNGPLLVATSIHPAAKPDPAVTAQENQLKALQKKLEAEQKQGDQMKADLEAGQAKLERQQADLERREAALNAQADELRSEQASLQAEQAALEARAARLQAKRDTLAAEARALAEQARSLARRLAFLRLRERRIKGLLATVTDPERIEELEERLALVQAAEEQTVAELKSVGKRARRLAAKARTLEAQAAELEQQKQSLEAQAAQLEAEDATLQRQGAKLEKQANALERQAAALEKQADQLQALQAKAKKQQKRAEQLQSELTKTLTKAGGDDRATDPRLVKLQDALIGTEGDSLVSPPELNKAGNAAVYTVIATTAPAEPATASLVKRLRSTVIPENLGEGMVAYVGGSTAGNVDLAAEITDKLPIVILTILLLSMIVLMVAFHSLLIPLQAALTNLLTALAAFGILTVVFQWGWGISLVGIDTTADSVPIASYVPLMMFAILFGLSMDYQVFLLSSVNHQRTAGESDRAAVGLGLQASARVIAAAALIMISVFSSFILDGDPVVKQFGVGLASAVALAATMVLMLAPAVLTLLGKWAWWFPDVLGRVVPTIDVEGTSLTDHDASPASVPTPRPARSP
jgi:uncharacterized membrane protein YdfJ with MMPL/SSD domain